MTHPLCTVSVSRRTAQAYTAVRVSGSHPAEVCAAKAQKKEPRTLEKNVPAERTQGGFYGHRTEYGFGRIRKASGPLFPQNADGRDARTDLTAKRTPKGRPSQLAGQEDYETAPIPNRIFTPVKSKKFWRYIPCISPNHMRRGLAVFIDIFFRPYMGWIVDTRFQSFGSPFGAESSERSGYFAATAMRQSMHRVGRIPHTETLYARGIMSTPCRTRHSANMHHTGEIHYTETRMRAAL